MATPILTEEDVLVRQNLMPKTIIDNRCVEDWCLNFDVQAVFVFRQEYTGNDLIFKSYKVSRLITRLLIRVRERSTLEDADRLRIFILKIHPI